MALLVTPIEDEKILTHPLFYEPFLLYTSDKNLMSQKTKVQQSDLNSADLGRSKDTVQPPFILSPVWFVTFNLYE